MMTDKSRADDRTEEDAKVPAAEQMKELAPDEAAAVAAKEKDEESSKKGDPKTK